MAGFGFKLGVAPFHMWAPDIYEGAAMPVTMFIATLPKVATFAVMVRLFSITLLPVAMMWGKLFLLMAILSIVIGNIVAILQTNIKRLLAYSSIAHMGYLLLGFVVATHAGLSAALCYIIIYLLANLAIFAVLLAVKSNGEAVSKITDLANLHKSAPLYAALLLLTLFSLAGVPPLLGFMGKMWLFNVLVQQDYVFIAIFAVLFTLLGLYYYIKVVKVMYFNDDSSAKINIVMPTVASYTAIINAILLLFIGIYPSGLFNLCFSLLGSI